MGEESAQERFINVPVVCCIAQELADNLTLQEADVLNVDEAICVNSGSALIDEGSMRMEEMLPLRRNCLKQRKEADEKHQDDYVRVSNILTNPISFWIANSSGKMGETAINGSRTHTTSHSAFPNAAQVVASQGRFDNGTESARQPTELQRAAFGQEDTPQHTRLNDRTKASFIKI